MIICLIFLTPLAVSAQTSGNMVDINKVVFTYDASGNRIKSATEVVEIPHDEGWDTISIGEPIGGRIMSARYSGDKLLFSLSRISKSDDCLLTLASVDGKVISAVPVSTTVTEIPVPSSPSECLVFSVALNGERKSWKFIKE